MRFMLVDEDDMGEGWRVVLWCWFEELCVWNIVKITGEKDFNEVD